MWMVVIVIFYAIKVIVVIKNILGIVVIIKINCLMTEVSCSTDVILIVIMSIKIAILIIIMSPLMSSS